MESSNNMNDWYTQNKREHVRLLLTAREAAAALCVCEKTLWSMTQRGAIPAIRIGKRGVRYSLDDLKEWIKKSREKSA